MSVIVKNMEMPKTCNDCGLRDSFDCWITDSYIEARFSKRNDDCPLIELPPHGRLKDVDKIEYEKLHIDDVGKSYEMVGKDDIDELPTVIEAEGSEE